MIGEKKKRSTPAAARIVINLPREARGKTALDAFALDRRTRELAARTTVTINGQTLWTQSFKEETRHGVKVLIIAVEPNSYEIK